MGKKRPVKPSELWGNEGIKQAKANTNTNTPTVQKMYLFNDKKMHFQEIKKYFLCFNYTCTHARMFIYG